MKKILKIVIEVIVIILGWFFFIWHFGDLIALLLEHIGWIRMRFYPDQTVDMIEEIIWLIIISLSFVMKYKFKRHEGIIVGMPMIFFISGIIAVIWWKKWLSDGWWGTFMIFEGKIKACCEGAYDLVAAEMFIYILLLLIVFVYLIRFFIKKKFGRVSDISSEVGKIKN